MSEVRASTDVDASGVGDRVVLYHRILRKALVLNPTGSFLWSQLDRSRTAAELAKLLGERFPGVDPEQARRDTDAFVAELREHGLLEPTSAGTRASPRTRGAPDEP